MLKIFNSYFFLIRIIVALKANNYQDTYFHTVNPRQSEDQLVNTCTKNGELWRKKSKSFKTNKQKNL